MQPRRLSPSVHYACLLGGMRMRPRLRMLGNPLLVLALLVVHVLLPCASCRAASARTTGCGRCERYGSPVRCSVALLHGGGGGGACFFFNMPTY